MKNIRTLVIANLRSRRGNPNKRYGSPRLLRRLAMTILHATFLTTPAFAAQKIVNVYAYTGDVPESIIKQFEKETGIHVNFSVFQNNEIMYTKLRTTPNAGYDIVMPSSYFVDRMARQGMLHTLDKHKLPNWKNVDPAFLNLPHDPHANYAVPFVWGTTGIFLNNRYHDHARLTKWSDLWNKQYHNQLMLLDDTREVFGMALISLGYNPSDNNPDHIKQAYEKLKLLMPNVKVFSADTVISIMIDEDATLGMAFNGDTYKASTENKHVEFVYPKDGFVLWIDSFAIPKNAPHLTEAYQFLNFILRADVGKTTVLETNYPIANAASKKLLPKAIRDNKTIFPSATTLKRSSIQTDPGDAALALYEKYWEALKMGA